MRGLLGCAFAIGLLVVLVPYPRLLPLSLVGWAVLWLATPATVGARR